MMKVVKVMMVENDALQEGATRSRHAVTVKVSAWFTYDVGVKNAHTLLRPLRQVYTYLQARVGPLIKAACFFKFFHFLSS